MNVHAPTARVHDHATRYPSLLSPYMLGDLPLKNRIVMAPMTRSRALSGAIPNPLSATYYTQRASAGLIISEATQVSPQGQGYIRTPGIYSNEQVEAWEKINRAIHKAGGKIFLQLWHVGRISHPEFHSGALPVSASAIAADGEVFTERGPKKMVAPRALERAEMPGIIEQFRKGAANAKKAGFDGVEIHGANGYLLDQFTRDGTNKRTNLYGGSIEKRARLPLAVTDAVIEVFGHDRVGYRISPNNPFNSMSDSDPVATFSYLTGQLSARKIAYLHVVDPIDAPERITPVLRKTFDGTYIVNGGFTADTANAAVTGSESDLVAFGVPFIANPDLPQRFATDAPLNAADPATFYQGEDRGYVDYPSAA